MSAPSNPASGPGSDDLSDLEATARRRLLDGETWADFCDTLKAAGDLVVSSTPDADDLDRVEGFRFLTRMTFMAFARGLERSTPTRRQGIFIVPPPLKGGIGVQNPNQDHVVQAIDPAIAYRVTGTAGDAYTHMSAWTPRVPDEVGTFTVGDDPAGVLDAFNPNANLTPHTALLDEYTDDEGNVDFVVSASEPDGPWFQVDPNTRELMMRIVYADRPNQARPELFIEPLVSVDDQPDIAPAAEWGPRLSIAGQLLFGMHSDYVDWTASLRQPENVLALSEHYERIGGSPDDRHFEFGYWRIAPDEALVIDFVEPPCLHWIFQLCNHWMENLPHYLMGGGFLAREKATIGADGSVRIVVSAEDPGLPNWVDPGVHDHGTMGLRFVQNDQTPETRTRLVKTSELEGLD